VTTRRLAGWGSLASALASQWLIAAGHKPAGIGLILVALALVWRFPLTRKDKGDGPFLPREGYWLGLVVLASLAIRLWGIGSNPPPMWIDEGRSGWWATRFLDGETWWGLPEGPEPITTYLLGFAFKWFGASLSVSRIVMALAGTATVGVMWWAIRPAYGPVPALLAAACLGLSRWHILESRLGTQFCLLPLFQVLVIGLFIRALRSEGRKEWLLLGLALGLGLYSYSPARAFPVVVAAPLIFGLAVGAIPRGRVPAIGAGAAITVAVALPIALYFAGKPGLLIERPQGLVSQFAVAPVAVGLRGIVSLISWLVVGGSGLAAASFPRGGEAPAFGSLGVALLLGGLSLARLPGNRSWNWYLLTAGLSILAVCAMTGLSPFRIGNLVVFACLIQGLAISGLAGAVPWPRMVVAAVLAGLFVQECPGFFGERFWSGERSRVEWEYRTGDTALASRIVAVCRRGPVFLSRDTAFPSLRGEIYTAAPLFLLHGKVQRFVPRDTGWVRKRGGAILFLFTTREKEELVQEVFPGGKTIDGVEGRRGLSGSRAYIYDCRSTPRLGLLEYQSLVCSVEDAGTLLARRNPGAAVRILDRALERWPGISQLYGARGVARLEQGETEGAMEDAGKAVRLGAGRNTRALNLVGLIHARQGEYAAAAGAWRRSVAVFPFQPEIWRNLVAALSSAGRRGEAGMEMSRARTIYPDFSVHGELTGQR